MATKRQKEHLANAMRVGRSVARRKAIAPKLAIPTNKAEQRQLGQRAVATDLHNRIVALQRKLAALAQAHDDEPDLLVTSAIAEQMHQVGIRLSELRKLGPAAAASREVR